MSNNSRGQIIVPQVTNVEITQVAGPLAQPASLAITGPAGVKLVVVGGLTKVEQLAGTIAVGLLVPGVTSIPRDGQWMTIGVDVQKHGPHTAPEETRDKIYERHIANLALNIAEAILAECERRAAAKQQATEQDASQ